MILIESGQFSQLTQVNGFKVWLYSMPLMRRHSLWVKELCFTTFAISSVTQFKTRKKNWGMLVRCVECAKLVGRTSEHSIQFKFNWMCCDAIANNSAHLCSCSFVQQCIQCYIYYIISFHIHFSNIFSHLHSLTSTMYCTSCSIVEHDQVIKSNEWLPFFFSI